MDQNKLKLEYVFAVTVSNRVVFQGGEAHIYTTMRQAEIGADNVKHEVGLRMRGYVEIKEINVDKLNSILE